MRQQQGQSMVEFAIAAPVAMLLLWVLLALGLIVWDYADLSFAARQAAFAAARAPSDASAHSLGAQAALESGLGSRLEDVSLAVDTGGFQRSGVVSVSATGYADLGIIPIASLLPGHRIRLLATCTQAIETFRSRAP